MRHVKKLDYRRTFALFQIVFATLTSQLHALGLCQQGPVVAVGVVCGNSLLNTSMQIGGFDGVVSGVYGLSFVAYSTMTLLSSVVFIDMVRLSHQDVAYYLAAWSWVNITFCIRSVRMKEYLEALYFLLISLGSLLDILGAYGVELYNINHVIIMSALILPSTRVSYSVFHMNDSPDGSTDDVVDTIDVLRHLSDASGINLSV